jgi:hypothetical protein
MERVEVTSTGCWEFTGATNGKGYGRIWTRRSGDKEYAHRVSYELTYGPIGTGLEIDHLCRNRRCVNPQHLEAVTRRVNQHRGYSVSGMNARKTRCARGHEFTPENTYLPSTGGRQCKTCRAAYRVANREKIRDLQRKWRRENIEEARAYKRAWRAKQKTLAPSGE